MNGSILAKPEENSDYRDCVHFMTRETIPYVLRLKSDDTVIEAEQAHWSNLCTILWEIILFRDKAVILQLDNLRGQPARKTATLENDTTQYPIVAVD